MKQDKEEAQLKIKQKAEAAEIHRLEEEKKAAFKMRLVREEEEERKRLE